MISDKLVFGIDGQVIFLNDPGSTGRPGNPDGCFLPDPHPQPPIAMSDPDNANPCPAPSQSFALALVPAASRLDRVENMSGMPLDHPDYFRRVAILLDMASQRIRPFQVFLNPTLMVFVVFLKLGDHGQDATSIHVFLWLLSARLAENRLGKQ